MLHHVILCNLHDIKKNYVNFPHQIFHKKENSRKSFKKKMAKEKILTKHIIYVHKNILHHNLIPTPWSIFLGKKFFPQNKIWEKNVLFSSIK